MENFCLKVSGIGIINYQEHCNCKKLMKARERQEESQQTSTSSFYNFISRSRSNSFIKLKSKLKSKNKIPTTPYEKKSRNSKKDDEIYCINCYNDLELDLDSNRHSMCQKEINFFFKKLEIFTDYNESTSNELCTKSFCDTNFKASIFSFSKSYDLNDMTSNSIDSNNPAYGIKLNDDGSESPTFTKNLVPPSPIPPSSIPSSPVPSSPVPSSSIPSSSIPSSPIPSSPYGGSNIEDDSNEQRNKNLNKLLKFSTSLFFLKPIENNLSFNSSYYNINKFVVRIEVIKEALVDCFNTIEKIILILKSVMECKQIHNNLIQKVLLKHSFLNQNLKNENKDSLVNLIDIFSSSSFTSDNEKKIEAINQQFKDIIYTSNPHPESLSNLIKNFENPSMKDSIETLVLSLISCSSLESSSFNQQVTNKDKESNNFISNSFYKKKNRPDQYNENLYEVLNTLHEKKYDIETNNGTSMNNDEDLNENVKRREKTRDENENFDKLSEFVSYNLLLDTLIQIKRHISLKIVMINENLSNSIKKINTSYSNYINITEKMNRLIQNIKDKGEDIINFDELNWDFDYCDIVQTQTQTQNQNQTQTQTPIYNYSGLPPRKNSIVNDEMLDQNIINFPQKEINVSDHSLYSVSTSSSNNKMYRQSFKVNSSLQSLHSEIIEMKHSQEASIIQLEGIIGGSCLLLEDIYIELKDDLIELFCGKIDEKIEIKDKSNDKEGVNSNNGNIKRHATVGSLTDLFDRFILLLRQEVDLNKNRINILNNSFENIDIFNDTQSAAKRLLDLKDNIIQSEKNSSNFTFDDIPTNNIGNYNGKDPTPIPLPLQQPLTFIPTLPLNPPMESDLLKKLREKLENNDFKYSNRKRKTEVSSNIINPSISPPNSSEISITSNNINNSNSATTSSCSSDDSTENNNPNISLSSSNSNSGLDISEIQMNNVKNTPIPLKQLNTSSINLSQINNPLAKFGLNNNEKILAKFSCALYPKGGIISQGKLCITQHYLTFSGWPEAKLLLKLSDIDNVLKTHTLYYFPNALEIITNKNDTYFFGSFIERESCFNMLKSLSEVEKHIVKLKEENNMVSSNDLIANPNINNNANQLSLEFGLLSHTPAPSMFVNSFLNSSRNRKSISNQNLSNTKIEINEDEDEDEDENKDIINEDKSKEIISKDLIINNFEDYYNKDSKNFLLLKSASINAPSNLFVNLLLETKFLLNFYEAQGDFDINSSEWEQLNTNSSIKLPSDLFFSSFSFIFTRKFDYKHPRTSMLMFGPPNAIANQNQFLIFNSKNFEKFYNNKVLNNNLKDEKFIQIFNDFSSNCSIYSGCFYTITKFDGIPMSDVFQVHQYLLWEPIYSSKGVLIHTKINYYIKVEFFKSSMFKSKIISGTREEIGLTIDKLLVDMNNELKNYFKDNSLTNSEVTTMESKLLNNSNTSISSVSFSNSNSRSLSSFQKYLYLINFFKVSFILIIFIMILILVIQHDTNIIQMTNTINETNKKIALLEQILKEKNIQI